MILIENRIYKYVFYVFLIGICGYILNIIFQNSLDDIKVIIKTYTTLKTIGLFFVSMLIIYFIGLYKKFDSNIFFLLLAIISLAFDSFSSYIVILLFLLNVYLIYMIIKMKYLYYDEAILVSLSYIIQIFVISYLVWILSHFNVNYSSVYFIILVIQYVVLTKISNLSLSQVFKNIHDIKIASSYSNIFLLIIFTIFTSIAYNITFDSDSLIKHFYVPRYIFLNGFFPYNIDEPVAFDISGIIPTYTYTFLYLMGGKGVFGLINLINFFLGIYLIKNIIEKYLGQLYGFISCAMIIFAPLMMLEFSYLLIDSFSFLFSCFIVYIFIDYLYSKNNNYIPLLFAVGNLSILSKLQMVYTLIPIYILILILDFRNICSKIKLFLFITFITGFIISIPLFYNYIITGNPIFPWYNGIFKSEYFWLSNFKDVRWSYPANVNLLYDITFKTSKFVEAANNSYLFGFHYFAILPLVIFTFFNTKFKKFFIVSLVFIISIFIMQNTTGLYTRYYLIILPLGTFVLLCIIASIYKSIDNIFIKSLFSLYISLIMLLNIVFFVNCSILNYVYKVYEKPHLFLYNDAIDEFYQTVNKIVEPNSKLLAFNDLKEKALYNYKLYSYGSYFDFKINELKNIKNESDMHVQLQNYNIKYFTIREDILDVFDNVFLKNIINNSREIFRFKSKTGHVFLLKEYIPYNMEHK